MTDHLPTTIQPCALAFANDANPVPARIAAAGKLAVWRYIDFFTARFGTA